VGVGVRMCIPNAVGTFITTVTVPSSFVFYWKVLYGVLWLKLFSSSFEFYWKVPYGALWLWLHNNN
jgi:hypothetical protein